MKSSDNYYQEKAIKYGVSKPRLRNILEITSSIGSKKKILDVGCASGILGKVFKRKNNEVYGVDISKKAIKEAKKVLDKALVVDVSSQKLPFKEEFDMVICSEVIEHLFKPINLLSDIHRVLKPGGYLVVTTPNILYFGHRIKFLLGKFRYQEEGPFDEGHIHFYSYSVLVEELSKVGFKILKENHVYPGTKLFKSRFPGFFAYQFVILAQK